MTPLLIEYGVEASVACDINTVSNVDKLSEQLRVKRPSVVLLNLFIIEEKNKEEHEHYASEDTQ